MLLPLEVAGAGAGVAEGVELEVVLGLDEEEELAPSVDDFVERESLR